jgi:starvation-inducible DNA-binding protein
MAKQTAKTRMFNTSIDIPQDAREQLVELLNQQLADTFDLMSQTKQAHWNVKGRDFYQLHELFDELAANLAGHVDSIAERATALGGTALGTARMAAENSRLSEYPTDISESMQHVECLTERYAALAAGLRQAINEADELDDQATTDLFTEIVRDVDKHLWFLEAHLQGGQR